MLDEERVIREQNELREQYLVEKGMKPPPQAAATNAHSIGFGADSHYSEAAVSHHKMARRHRASSAVSDELEAGPRASRQAGSYGDRRDEDPAVAHGPPRDPEKRHRRSRSGRSGHDTNRDRDGHDTNRGRDYRSPVPSVSAHLLVSLAAQVDKLVADSKQLQAQLGDLLRQQRGPASRAPSVTGGFGRGTRQESDDPGRDDDGAYAPKQSDRDRDRERERRRLGPQQGIRRPGHPSAMLDELGARSHAGSYDF
jgi:hypothetical protein